MSDTNNYFVPEPVKVNIKSASEIRDDKDGRSSIFLTILHILGCLTILFPLYMTVIIAFKSPSEMTNDIWLCLKIVDKQQKI